MRGAVVGLLIMMAGCLLFIPAAIAGPLCGLSGHPVRSGRRRHPGSGGGNPLTSMLGEARTASSRLTFAQAFNSLGTTIFLYVGATLILGSLGALTVSELSGPALTAYRVAEAAVISQAYIDIAVALAVVALVVWFNRRRLIQERAPLSVS